jgi:hypothetical protein
VFVEDELVELVIVGALHDRPPIQVGQSGEARYRGLSGPALEA